jgi:hypothetical protein
MPIGLLAVFLGFAGHHTTDFVVWLAIYGLAGDQ